MAAAGICGAFDHIGAVRGRSPDPAEHLRAGGRGDRTCPFIVGFDPPPISISAAFVPFLSRNYNSGKLHRRPFYDAHAQEKDHLERTKSGRSTDTPSRKRETEMSKTDTRRRLALLFLFVFVDVLGFSLILPLLPY